MDKLNKTVQVFDSHLIQVSHRNKKPTTVVQRLPLRFVDQSNRHIDSIFLQTILPKLQSPYMHPLRVKLVVDTRGHV